MSLAAGDLTTPARVMTWMGLTSATVPPSIPQLIGSMSALIYGKLNRARLFSQTFTRTFDGVGSRQLVLPDWPVTNIVSLQQGSVVIPNSTLSENQGYGYRFVPWSGNLPGDPCIIELIGCAFWIKLQNIRVVYQAGYLISGESNTVPASAPYQVSVQQPLGICCLDAGVTYASGQALVPVASAPAVGQYIPPTDAAPGVYTFNAGDANAVLGFSYSFVPADLEEACVQMVAERYSYRARVGELNKSLGGQESVAFLRGRPGRVSGIPPEVMDLINPYISVVPPAMGAPA